MKKINFYGILFASIILFSANRCHPENDDCHRFIHFTNKSGKDIYYIFNIFDEINEYNPALAGEMNRIKNNENTKLPNSHSIECYESFPHEETGMIYLFLFDSEVAENYDWETVRQNNMYLKKYVLTIDELNEMNWKITYSED